MSIINHLTKNPFITATAIAAFVHTTWSIATIFGGSDPGTANWLTWLTWVAPAAAIAFALDIGQINTSIEIQELHMRGIKPTGKYITFGVLSAFVYYLQWWHLIHHFPDLALASGVGQSAVIFNLRLAAVWIIPALLPLSTLLYTFSLHVEASTDTPLTHTLRQKNKKREPNDHDHARENGIVSSAENNSRHDPHSNENTVLIQLAETKPDANGHGKRQR